MNCYYLAIDPGGTTGLAMFNLDGGFEEMTDCKAGEIIEVLSTLDPKEVIIETYRPLPKSRFPKQHVNPQTIQLIGNVQAWCQINRRPLHGQDRAIKPTAYKWAGKKPLPKSNPLNHQLDAFVHGVYFLQKHKGVIFK